MGAGLFGRLYRFLFLTVLSTVCQALLHQHEAIRGHRQLECGKWQKAYAQLQNETLFGIRGPRYAISVAVESDLADRLTGIISQFYYALITERAFQVVTYGNLPGMEDVFDSQGYINWLQKPFSDDLIGPLKYTYKGERGYSGFRGLDYDKVSKKEFAMMYMINSNFVHNHFGSSNLRHLPPGHADAEVVFMASNRGGTVRLFNNQYHSGPLKSMGLLPRTAFSCAYDFLFRPKEAALEAHSDIILTLSKRPPETVIGIEIRVDTLGKMGAEVENAKLEDFLEFFECAQDIEDSLPESHQAIVWYLISDSAALRTAARAEYGEKILLDCTGRQASLENCKSGKSYGQDVASLQYAAGQLSAFSFAGHHVSLLP